MVQQEDEIKMENKEKELERLRKIEKDYIESEKAKRITILINIIGTFILLLIVGYGLFRSLGWI